MHVSVVIPTYNGGRYLRRTMESVQAQSIEHWDLTVIDDGSTDESPAIVRALSQTDSRIRLISQTNQGIAAARNRGIRELPREADFVAFLDHDDLWEPDALRNLLAAAEANPGSLGSHGRVGYIDSEGRDISYLYSEPRHHRRPVLRDRIIGYLRDEEPTDLQTLSIFCCITTVGQVLLRKDALGAIGDFDPEMVPSDDYDYWIRLSMLGNLTFTNREVIKWRRHAGNTSGDDSRMLDALNRIRVKWLARTDLCESVRATLSGGAVAAEEISMALRREWAASELRNGHPLRALRQYRHLLKTRAKLQDMRKRLQVPM